jgi:phosphohistidine phosphatase
MSQGAGVMSRELLLLRHGKSDWDTQHGDFDRPLKDRGKRSAQRIGSWIMENDRLPDHVLSSPAVRAIETSRKCVKAMGLAVACIHEAEAIYEASVQQLLALLAECPPRAKRVMLVGHNPGLEELLAWLLGEALVMPADGKLMPTATLACLAMPDDWSRLESGCAGLQALIRPRSLPRDFPYPAANGSERRDRPAYYYTQSAVIPYRMKQGELQVLLVSSSSNRHWVVPKGIHDPGLSAQDSAAKEALEEAGVLKGEVARQALGRYTYSKWGSRCEVTVFAMAVRKLVDDTHWDQDYRQRKWVPVNKVAGYLKQAELADLAGDLARSLADNQIRGL